MTEQLDIVSQEIWLNFNLSLIPSYSPCQIPFLLVTDIKEPKSITWLENSLPKSTASFQSDAEEVAKLTEEARLLEEEMKKEVLLNTELQKQIAKSRERNDQMVAMVQLLRTETEAALERYDHVT